MNTAATCRPAGAAAAPWPLPLAVVGSIALDTVETPRERRENLLGGSVSYACAAASYFVRNGMVGVVGEDFPAAYEDLYRRMDIDLAGLQKKPGKTFRWTGVYERNMNVRRTLATELNVFESFSPDLPAACRQAPFILLGNISPELQLHVLAQAQGAPFVATDTMDLWIRAAREDLMRVIARSSLLTLNDEEARLLTGCESLDETIHTLLAWGPGLVIVKRGEYGAVLGSAAGRIDIPAFAVADVVDPTGAGDSFAGALMGRLAAAGDTRPSLAALRQALLYGSAVASFNVEGFSLDTLAHLTRERIEARYRELAARTAEP
jgi:cytidine kinase